jgi:ribosome-binding factor A
MSAARAKRLEAQLCQELADILRRELRDPRVGGVSFTAARVTPDLERATVYFTVFQGEPAEAEKGLNRAVGFLRCQLAQRLTTRTVPQLHFRYDSSIERGAYLSQLIDSAIASDRSHSDQ